MNAEIEFNEYDVLITIFRFVRDYHTGTYTLPDVCRKLLQYLVDAGYQAEIVDGNHRDYKIIQVETQRYKLTRYKGWSTYDVIMTA